MVYRHKYYPYSFHDITVNFFAEKNISQFMFSPNHFADYIHHIAVSKRINS